MNERSTTPSPILSLLTAIATLACSRAQAPTALDAASSSGASTQADIAPGSSSRGTSAAASAPIDRGGGVKPTARDGAARAKPCAGGPGLETLSDLAPSPGEVVAADLDGDHRLDLIVAQADPDAGVRVLFNTGSSLQTGQWRCTQLPADSPANRLTVGDIDGDGALDIVGGSWMGLGIQWWRLDKKGSLISKGVFTVPPPEPKGDCVRSGDHVQLASVELGDVEADGRLWLGTTLYSRAINHEACLTQRLWQFDPAAKTFVERRKLKTPGAMRARFVDVDGDDFLDYVESSSTIGCSDGGQSNCSDRAEWGDWFSRAAGTRRSLTVSIPGSSGKNVPGLRAVDFDVWPSGLSKRLNQPAAETLFALAITSEDACETDDCWDDLRQGGYVVAVRTGGKIEWSSKDDELPEEAKNKPSRLAPRSVVFAAAASGPGPVAAYRWARHCITADCSLPASLNAIVDHGGATRDCRQGLGDCTAPFKSTSGALFQAMIAAALRDDTLQTVEDEQDVRKGQRIAYLARRHVAEVEAVAFRPAGAADDVTIRYTYVPGDSWITIEPAHTAGRLRLKYRATDKPDMVLADSNQGLSFF